MGYAQSWALVRMLLEERTEQMRNYLADIYYRKTPDRRLDDFTRHFGTDIERLELRYGEYVHALIERHHKPPQPKRTGPGGRPVLTR
jgi:hypothetical protein